MIDIFSDNKFYKYILNTSIYCVLYNRLFDVNYYN